MHVQWTIKCSRMNQSHEQKEIKRKNEEKYDVDIMSTVFYDSDSI